MANPHILIIEARFYNDLADMLLQGAIKALEDAGATYDVMSVPGALEIPAVVKMAAETDKFDAHVALGCVIRGQTYHFEIVANESARGLTWLSIDPGLLIGNGILTCENEAQAVERADPARGDKGGDAVKAALKLLDVRGKLKAA